MSVRIGTGYDVHKLVPAKELIIGGVSIPNSLGALGYSDADVLIHAIADAILGAAALGDLGKHFPGSDPSIKGMEGFELLSRVMELLKQYHYSISNIDSTVILQKPKISPYITEMRQNISNICNIELDKVSVKATTTDFLGITGREEGIAAMAAVLICENDL